MSIIKKRLFYDIETSFCKGHFWRPGWNKTILPSQILEYAKIISIHYKWEGQKEIHNLNWGLKKQCDKKLVKKFIKEMNKADEIITYNGKRFDTPWIRTRAMYHNIPMVYQYNEIDCYKQAKKYLNLPSYSLKEVCKYFELPLKKNAGGMETWVNVVIHKQQAALDHLLFYGDGDITSLEAVFKKFLPYVQPNMHYSTLKGNKKFHCPECASLSKLNKTYATAAGTIQNLMLCRDIRCNTYFKVNNKTYMDYLQYKLINKIP